MVHLSLPKSLREYNRFCIVAPSPLAGDAEGFEFVPLRHCSGRGRFSQYVAAEEVTSRW